MIRLVKFCSHGKDQRALPEKHFHTEYNKLVYGKMKVALQG